MFASTIWRGLTFVPMVRRDRRREKKVRKHTGGDTS
jgi:hypothetical protein